MPDIYSNSKHSPLIDFWIFGPERGCLMRETPIIRELRKHGPFRARLFVHPTHVEMARILLPDENTEIFAYPGGISYVYNSHLDFSVRKTALSILKYALIDGWRDYFFYRKIIKTESPDLVVNDFLPLVPLYARFNKLPVIGIYNYLMSETSLGSSIPRRLLGYIIKSLFNFIYRLSNQIVLEQILPAPDNDRRWHQVPPVARSTTRSTDVIRREISPDNKPLIFLSLGGGNTKVTESYLARFIPLAQSGKWNFLLLPRSSEEQLMLQKEQPDFIIGDSDWVETQDIIASCDLVIARAGFTTVAECLKAQVPILTWHLKAHPEIRETEAELARNSLSAGILYPDDPVDTINDKIGKALASTELRNRLAQLPTDGAEQAAQIIRQML